MRALFAIALAGCFGPGDLPTAPSEATTIYTVPPPLSGQECSSAEKYIGDVALGATVGFLVTLPYSPRGCNGGGGPSSPVDVTQFDLAGVAATSIAGSAGMWSEGFEVPRVAASGDVATWAYEDTSMNALKVQSGANVVVITMASGGGGPAALTTTADGGTVVAGVSHMMTPSSPNSPDYPCCVTLSTTAPTMSFVSVIASGGTTATPVAFDAPPKLFCETLDSCVVTTPSSMFIVEHAGLGPGLEQLPGAQVVQIPAAGPSVVIDTLTTEDLSDVVPVGMAADDTGVVYAASQDPSLPAAGPGCVIRRYDGTSVTTLLTTTSFDCQDIAIDATSAYFAITSVSDENGGSMRGLGIGRVRFDADHAFDSIRLDMAGSTAGPRRLVVAGEYVYAMDPFAIGRIKIADIQGHSEFAK